MIPIPFKIRRATRDSNTYLQTATHVHGLVGMEDDEVVLQYRITTVRQRIGAMPERTESEVGEARIPLDAIRRAEVRRGWFRTRVVLLPANLHSFGGIPGFTGDELVLTIPRAERAGAADLVSSIEMALSTRLLDGPSGGRRDPNLRIGRSDE